MKVTELRQQIGYVIQQQSGLHMTVAQNIAVVAGLARKKSSPR